MIFITSDHHFNHLQIIKYENRPFGSVDEMNHYMINHWNERVSKNDTVYHLGDVAFGNSDAVKDIVSQLNGYKILVLGNHDKRKTRTWWHNAGFNDVYEDGAMLNKFFMLTHKPIYLNDRMPYVNIHGHIHGQKYDSNQYYNVCVEHHDYYPVSFDEICKYYAQFN